MVLVRSPRGALFSHRIDLEQNPNRVIYQIEVYGDCTSADRFGAEEFSMGELKTTIKQGAALKETPVRLLGISKRRFS